MAQLDLFDHITASYANASGGCLTNDELYKEVAERAGISRKDLDARQPIGKAGTMRSPLKRAIRWYQQDLRAMGVIEKVEDARGVWQLTEAAGRKLHRSRPGVKMLAFSTDLGIAIWGSNSSFFPYLGEPIVLGVTSPPYPLRSARAYGTLDEQDYVDFICRTVEPIVENLAPNGSLCINVSNDIFLKGSPERSLYKERLMIALKDRLGLAYMDTLIWDKTSAAPGPIQWASKNRVHLNVGWEPIYWFAKDPMLVMGKANNQRVLLPHSDRQKALIAQGGEQREAVFSDGAYRIHHGSFGNPTAGRIPRNVFSRGHNCRENSAYRRFARSLGFQVHGAMFPYWLPAFLIEFLTDVGDLVVDPFAGSFKTCLAAERLGRRWAVTELMLDYARPSGEQFRDATGFWMDPAFESVRGPHGPSLILGHPYFAVDFESCNAQ